MTASALMIARRRSPLGAWFQAHPVEHSAYEPAPLRLQDLSWRRRFGCKGPASEAWLTTGGYRVPATPNSAVVDPNGVLVMRLASSEFLIEAVDADLESGTSTRARLLQPAHAAGVYPVVRQDLTVGISGKGLNGLLRQICSVDFLPLLETDALDGGPIILTSMIGVGVIAWPRRLDAEPALTLWCDPSFAHYFWSTLLEVARGSGAVTINPPADWTGV